MLFDLGPSKITKEVLLNHYTEEAYMAYYLGVNPKKGLFRSPLRSDNNPTCSIYRNNKGELIYKDFGDGFHGNFITVVMKIFNVPYYKALNIIANDFGIVKKENYTVNQAKIVYNGTLVEEKEPTIIQCEVQEFTKRQLKWWDDQGVSESTLKKFNVHSIKHVFLNGSLHATSSDNNPIYGYYFGIKDGVEQWKIYFPKKKSYRFLLNTSIIQGLKQLPKTTDHIVITKSLKDVMALYELGITAIAPQAESVVLSKTTYDKLCEKYNNPLFIVNGDWDKAGKLFMIKSRRTFPCICLSFTNKIKFGKDISDFIKLHGREKAITLINKLKLIVAKRKLHYQLKRFDIAA